MDIVRSENEIILFKEFMIKCLGYQYRPNYKPIVTRAFPPPRIFHGRTLKLPPY